MRAKTRVIIERCIEEGIRHGYRRAHKYVDNPSESGFIDNISASIWLELDSYFMFDES